jgi:GTP-binding protein
MKEPKTNSIKLDEKGKKYYPPKGLAKTPRKNDVVQKPAKPKEEPTHFEVMDAVYLATATDYTGLPSAMLTEIAFGGRSNVGKSSLINRLVNRRKLVRTSSTPGATRGLSIFRTTLRLEGGARAQVDLVDLPGYGFAARSKEERNSWGGMIEGYIERRGALRLVVLLIDVRRGLEDDDLQLIEYLAHQKKATLLVVTKIDKVARNEREKILAGLKASVATVAKKVPIVASSAETGEGRDDVWRMIRRHAFIGVEPEEMAAPKR